MAFTSSILLTTSGSGSFIKPYLAEKLIIECWGGGGRAETGQLGQNGAGGAGGQYARSTIIYPSAEQTISYYVGPATSVVSQPIADTIWDNGVVVAKKGAQGSGLNSRGIGTTAGGVGEIVYKGGDGAAGGIPGTAGKGGGGGGAGSTGNGSNANNGNERIGVPRYGGFATPEFGGTGGSGLNTNGGLYGGGGHGAQGVNNSGAQGLIRVTIVNEQKISKVTWSANDLFILYLDNATSYSAVIDGSEFVRIENGYEYSWVPNTNYIFQGDVRWIPTTSTAAQTGWDGGDGWRAFLEYARAKNKFNFYLNAFSQTPIESYLVEPLNGEHSLEIDGTRRISLVIRNTTTPYEGF